MNRKTILLLILIFFIIIFIIQLSLKDNGRYEILNEDGTISQETGSGASVSSTPGSTLAPTRRTTPTSTTDPRRVYEEALVTYAGRIIQFDAGCQASPRSMTLNNGTSVMFDNRSGDARWISLDGTGYNIAGYGYKIIPVRASTTPYTVKINCGSAVNVGSILLQ